MDAQKFDVMKALHTIIGICIILFGRYLPAPQLVVESSEKLLKLGFPAVDGGVLLSISPVGMTVATIFLGVVYLWTFVDTLWPCFLGVLMLGISEYAPMPKVLSSFMGNPSTVFIFVLLIFAAVLIKSNISAYLARWLMTRSIAQGRPWVFTALILLATYLVAFLDQVSCCFLMWPALYAIFERVGYKKGDRYVTLMVVNTMIMILLSFASDPVKGGAFYLLVNLSSLAAASPELHAQPLNFAAYLAFSGAVSLACMAVILFLMRFVFRVDVSRLKNFDLKVLDETPLPPMSARQKAIIALFLAYVTWMLLPGIIGKANAVGAFLAANSLAGPLVAVFCLTFLTIGREPIANICKDNAAYPWRVFFLIATAFLLGGAMTGKGTNVTIVMEYALRGWLGHMSYGMLTATVVVIAIITTNFCNSVVAGLVFTPVLLALSNALGYSAAPMLACFFFTVLVAAATPAASPFAALLFDNPWLEKKQAAGYAVLSSAVVVLVMIVLGMPLANILF